MRLRLRVVRLAEVHDVDAVRPERRAHRRGGRRLPRGDLDLDHCGQPLLRHFPALRSRPDYSFETWPNSSSTGVSRPKMFTSTLSFERSTSISLIAPLKSANGPATTRTCSPVSNSSRGRAFFCATSAPSTFPTPRMSSTSRRDSGVGLAPLPTNPVTPGVLRTTYHESSSSSWRTRRYPGKTFFCTTTLRPPLNSITSSIGMTTS